MSITTMDGIVSALASKYRWYNFNKLSIAAGAGNTMSLWDTDGAPGAGSLAIGNVANGLVPTNATAGAFLHADYTGGDLGYLSRFDLDYGSVVATYVLYDRLWHSGSHALTPTRTVSLTSQPSFSGRVPSDFSETEIWLEINAAVAASAVMVNVSYTNELGVNGRTTTMPVANLASFIARRMIPLLLQAGDKGVSQIDSVLITGVAAATGSVNVVVLRRIASRAASQAGMGGQLLPTDPISSGMRRIYAGSCLALMCSTSTTSTGNMGGTFSSIGG